MAKATGQALWDFCEDLLAKGAGYVWGGRGKVYDEKEAETLYKSCGNGTYNEKYYMVTSMQRWKGKIVVDCSGMIQAFRIAKLDGVDRTANSLYEKDCPADKRGTIDTLPRNLRGVLLFMSNGSRMGHVGVYGGDNTTIESSNSKKGVIKRDPMIESCWTHWGIPTWLEPTVIGEEKTEETPKVVKPIITPLPTKKEENSDKKAINKDDVDAGNTTTVIKKPTMPLKSCRVSKCYRLNVRKGPSITNPSIATLGKDDIVDVYAIKGNWAKIDDDEEKWCSTKYLVELPKYEVVNCSSLNVRTGPGVKNKIVKILKKGDIVFEYGIASNGWIQIGKDKYVSNKYVKKIQ